MALLRSPLRSLLAPALAMIGAAGCATGANKTLSGGGAGAGGDGDSGGGGATPGTTSTTTSSTTSTTPSPGTGCPLGHLVISEIRTRGLGGASDELIELYNASPEGVTLDSTWTIDARKASAAAYTTRWTGDGGTIAPYGHFLITGSAYAQSPAADAKLSSGISDAASVRLAHGGVPVDALCFYFTDGGLAAYDASYTCEGTPVSNLPHDDTATVSSNVDTSLRRLPSGGSPDCSDTGDSATDFAPASPADPQNTASPPTP